MIGIVHAICPKRHRIWAITYDADHHSDSQAIDALNEDLARRIEAGEQDPWCGMCGAKKDKWMFEAFETKYETLADIAPVLATIEDRARRTRLRLEKAGKTYDSRIRTARVNR